MKTLDVYPLFDIEPVKARDCFVWDHRGIKYLDFYGGHAVISIGHSHPHYIERITTQLEAIGFYSNAVRNSLQEQLAEHLGRLSGYESYHLFLVNSGAEAIENALKIAAFHNQRKRVIVFEGAFHGRTSAAVAITHNSKIQSSLNPASHVAYIPINDWEKLEAELHRGDVCAVVVEGIQGVGGIHVTDRNFWREARKLCDLHNTLLIADEIQSGYGRTGKFFAHQYSAIAPDLITVAKGMGNGFPIGGVLIHPRFKPWHGMLGTTFGGNHLACAAALAVLEVIEQEDLMSHTTHTGNYLMEELKTLPDIQEVRGKGLMIGLQLPYPVKPVRETLLYEHHIFTGSSSDPHVLRLLPPMTLSQSQADYFVDSLKMVLETVKV